ncbi:hypothetical protein PHLCEN_2v10820 [Hermanssonia centrifuga]|uniref:RRM domain-containing protein n=1 Tax=Hermanssonia centrifuga TaxID=98765 RepID=A0A2R6NM26_9APHY|nr:hypothetical protein PHLCEN_2v10820 [Hermanssonia centrifuga]
MSVTTPYLRSFSISRSNYNTLGLGLTQGEPLPTKKYGASRNGKLELMERSGRSELKIGSGGDHSRCIASQRAHASRRMQAEGAVNRLFDSAPFCMDGDSPRNLDRKNSGYQQDYPQAGPSREGIRPIQRYDGGARSTSSTINDYRGMESRSSPLRNLPKRPPGVGPAGSYCTVIKVSGLPDTITKEELKEAFGKFGDVRIVRLSVDRKGMFDNSAHVAFYTVDDAQDAADSQDPIILHGSSLRWHLDFHFVKGESLEPTPMLFMLNVPPDTPKDVIRAKFRDVTEVWDVIYNDQGKNYVHINVPSAEDAKKVMDRHRQRPYSFGSGSLKIAYTNPSSTIGRTISQYRHVSKSGDDASYKSFKRRGPPSASIFVAGFPAGTSQAHIRHLFERFAEVKAIRIGE